MSFVCCCFDIFCIFVQKINKNETQTVYETENLQDSQVYVVAVVRYFRYFS